jgi:uncharacterized protein (TIGR02996 family)
MDADLFFLLIDGSRQHAGGVGWASMVGLLARLHALADDELRRFDEQHSALTETLRSAPAGDSVAFSSAVLWRGRAVYERALADPLVFFERELASRLPPIVPIPIDEELRRRRLVRSSDPEGSPDAACWSRREGAERQLLRGELPRAWRQHEDRYVRALAWLAHPPPPHPELFDAPERLGVYLACRSQAQPRDLEALTALMWMELWSAWPGSRRSDPARAFDRTLLWEGLASVLREASARDSVSEVIRCRLSARPDEPELSRHDPLRLPQGLLEDWQWRLPLLEHPHAPAVLRFLLGWLERQDRRTPFAQHLLADIVQVGRSRGLTQPLEPEEAELVQAVLRSAGDSEPKLVYADWCAQRGRPVRPVELLQALREVLAHEALPDRLEVAGALGSLGERVELDLLIAGLSDRQASPGSLAAALWAHGPAAAAALPAMRERAQTEFAMAVVCARLQPWEPRWAEILLEELPDEAFDEDPEHVRRAIQALVLVLERQPGLREEAREVALSLVETLPPEEFADELRWCAELVGTAPG